MNSDTKKSKETELEEKANQMKNRQKCESREMIG